ncbi:MAG: UDP-N-acetylmuramate dehydrogenase [Myxococcales bacterium]|nr:UDP-N-acetylmuramate dehydrogenase [Myxococcales bacterium]
MGPDQPEIRRDVALSPYTTMELGGAAEHLCLVTSRDQLRAALAWAAERGEPVTCLGGGSNVLVPDAGLPGLTIVLRLRGIAYEAAPGRSGLVLVKAQAGEPFEGLVAATVGRELAGLECLSGIPGLVGATPIQNVGAYGREVSEVIHSIDVFDRERNEFDTLGSDRCGFGYRDSRLKRDPHRFVVVAVTYALTQGGAGLIRYPELAERLACGSEATLANVRAAVLSLRRAKSMVIEGVSDENRRSVGSFFVNPVISAERAEALVRQALVEGLVERETDVPCFGIGAGRCKLSAAWLIERAGFQRGLRRGAVGISSRHTLALVHHGGGTTGELLALAEVIRVGVRRRFGVELQREPTLLGQGMGA